MFSITMLVKSLIWVVHVTWEINEWVLRLFTEVFAVQEIYEHGFEAGLTLDFSSFSS